MKTEGDIIEIWQPVIGYETLYEVSNKGRIRSLPKSITYPCGRVQHYPAMIRKPVINSKNGYVYIGLTKDRKQKGFRLHRIVAEAFLPNPNGFEQVNHKNFEKTDNRVENLEWCDGFTQQQHAATKPGRRWQRHRSGMVGKLNPKSKPVVKINPVTGEIIEMFESGCLAAKSTSGAIQSKISKCCLGARKTHAGFKWAFADALIEALNKENK